MPIKPEEAAAIAEARAEQSTTRRRTVPALEALIHQPIHCLDHGFVRVVDYMGDDSAIVQAARVSYGKGTRRTSDDRMLIRYLMRNRHTSPFEMCEIKLHVKLPIFVARQWVRHRTAKINEYSARYSLLDKEFYVPDPENIAVQATDNKQGRGHALSPEAAAVVRQMITEESEAAHHTYEKLMDDHQLARELARAVLPVGFYTQWYWKIDLHNLLHFLALRMDRHAQYEIRVYAEAIGQLVQAWVPLVWDAFVDYRLQAVSLSRPAIRVVQRMLAGEQPTQEDSDLTRREWEELMGVLKP